GAGRGIPLESRYRLTVERFTPQKILAIRWPWSILLRAAWCKDSRPSDIRTASSPVAMEPCMCPRGAGGRCRRFRDLRTVVSEREREFELQGIHPHCCSVTMDRGSSLPREARTE